MESKWKPKLLMTKRDLAVDVLLCLVADVQWRLKKCAANISVYVEL